MKKILLIPVLLALFAANAAARNVTLSPRGGGKDDRSAIMQAVKDKGVDTLFLAEGEFVLGEPVVINAFVPERTVIVGAGAAKTVLKGSQTGAFVVSDVKPHDVFIGGLTIRESSRCEAGADKGGAVFVDCRGGSLRLDAVTIEQCTALSGGGAICSSGTDVTLRRCTLSSNRVTSEDRYAGFGGAIYFYASNGHAEAVPEARLKVEDCSFEGNSAVNSGGAVCVYGNAKFGIRMKLRLEMSNCTVAGNRSSNMAGGIYAASYAHESGAAGGNVSLRIDGSSIVNNQAGRKNSVGLGCGATGYKPRLDMTGTTISGNETSAAVSEIWDADLSLFDTGGDFRGNRFGKVKGVTAGSENRTDDFSGAVPVAAVEGKTPVAAVAKTAPVAAKVACDYGGLLAQVLQSGMVVQQGKPFTLWGNAPAGQKVVVEADWAPRKEVCADADGVWKLSVDVPRIAKGERTAHALTVISGGQSQRLEELLFGEVWLLSGQSNMTMYMEPFQPWHNGVTDYRKEIAAADYPCIRIYSNPKKSTDEPNNISGGTWHSVTPETVAKFSAVGYYFARKIHLETGYPVGIVLTALGAMACETFTPAQTLMGDPALKAMFWDPWQSGKVTAFAKRPSHLYNGMIHPFINLSIRGFGWYQGESNAGHIDIYDRLCSAMIGSWRERFAQGELPFYFMMVVPYSWKSTDINKYGYSYFRETQERIARICPNTDIASAMDCGEFECVHPSAKKPVGERLAALALHHDYGWKGVFKGPVFGAMNITGSTVTIRFKPETIGSGLETSDGAEADFFYLAGEDRVFYKASARIVGDGVELRAPQVARPVAARYAFLAFLKANFQNKEGFSAYPFRTDDWTDATYFVAD